MDQVGVVDLEGLADVLNGNGEDGGTYRDSMPSMIAMVRGSSALWSFPCRDHW